ncbi:6-phosphofructo-2-kinase [Lasius niger]|uniref:6-phosphofructo-2-kinase n=1 Tax=Lasius niger TaxID=67767 RepID=A0A0J7KLW2_LASNI|nr:6-phosphofructo-2-kinase [Lasius niger]
MPWVAACFDLLAAPLLGYCLAIRKLALQAGILQERRSDLVEKQTSNTGAISNTEAATMVPNAEERQGKVRA